MIESFDLSPVQALFSELDIKRQILETVEARTRKDIVDLGEEMVLLEKTSDVLNSLAKTSREKTIGLIETLVTHALRSIWEEPFDFRIETVEKRGVTQDQPKLLKDGVEASIMDGHGGGIVNVVAFVLRLIFILKKKPALRKVVFLDEPFAYVSANYQPKVGELLRELTEKLGIDMLMVTHQEILESYADLVYTLKATNDGVITAS